MNLVRIAKIGLATLLIFLLLGFLFPGLHGPGERIANEKIIVTQLSSALEGYRSEYGNFPQGNQPSIISELTGRNPKGIIFYEVDSRRINSKGELTDMWGIPYKIEFSGHSNPHVSSAGKNMKLITRIYQMTSVAGIRPNKALQLTPSRTAPVSYDRSAFPFTSFLELVRPFGVAELGVRAL